MSPASAHGPGESPGRVQEMENDRSRRLQGVSSPSLPAREPKARSPTAARGSTRQNPKATR
eukprot:12639945-Alexandrium_andersonii.AAC.1